jgi:hypothetical protein
MAQDRVQYQNLLQEIVKLGFCCHMWLAHVAMFNFKSLSEYFKSQRLPYVRLPVSLFQTHVVRFHIFIVPHLAVKYRV